jgi:nickel transport protein
MKAMDNLKVIVKILARNLLIILSILVITIIGGVFPASAHAHKVNLHVVQAGGMVFVEGFYHDGTPCVNSTVEVLDASTGEKLSEVRTDSQGKVVLKSFKGRRLKLVLNAGIGHRTQYVIEHIADAANAEAETGRAAGQPETAQPETAQAKLEAAVATAVAKEIAPLREAVARLEKLQSRPRAGEIIGGIGYIAGLFGLLMYYKSKNRK